MPETATPELWTYRGWIIRPGRSVLANPCWIMQLSEHEPPAVHFASRIEIPANPTAWDKGAAERAVDRDIAYGHELLRRREKRGPRV